MPRATGWVDPLGFIKCIQTFYRGDSRRGLDFIKSHEARENGYSSANGTLASTDKENLMKKHAADSLKNVSPYVSITTNKKVAEYFATDGGATSGYVYGLKIPCDRIIQNVHNHKAVLVGGKYIDEDEWLVKNYIRPSEIS